MDIGRSERSTLCRGGVVVGSAYHHHRVVFGPAVIHAYELEQDVAKYPRIVVTDAVRNAAWDYHQGFCRGKLFLQDIDGCWFINVFEPAISKWAPLAADDDDADRRTFLKEVRRHLKQQLKTTHADLRHSVKVRWAVNYFNRVANDEGLPAIDVDQIRW